MASYICEVCGYVFSEEKEGVKWEDLPDDWVCPVCESSKACYRPVETETGVSVSDTSGTTVSSTSGFSGDMERPFDELEIYMKDIHQMAETGEPIVEPMRTKAPTFSWDDILIKGAQLARIPLNHDEPVNTETKIGPNAKEPLVISTPIYITHMSFGALSKEAKIALTRGSAAVKTAMCSGEGGIFPESLENAYKYIFEYVPNRYSVTE